jgi:hypothetical protein
MTLVAVADVHAPARLAHSRTDLGTTPAPAVRPSASEPPLCCPACGLPATVEWRDMMAGTSGPVIHVKVRCPLGRHWFLMPEEGL